MLLGVAKQGVWLISVVVKPDFSKKYEICNYAYLDQLNDAKKIDYSIELL